MYFELNMTVSALLLCSNNFPDVRLPEQREVTSELDKIVQGECLHTLVQYLCKDKLESLRFQLAFSQLT